jgi:hypothetical protein
MSWRKVCIFWPLREAEIWARDFCDSNFVEWDTEEAEDLFPYKIHASVGRSSGEGWARAAGEGAKSGALTLFGLASNLAT